MPLRSARKFRVAAIVAIAFALAPAAFAQSGAGGGAIGDSIRAGSEGSAPSAPAAAASVAPDVVDQFNSNGDSITVVGGVPDATASPAADSGAVPAVVSAPAVEAAPSVAAAPSPEAA
ncbi:MAG: hypothetical protein WA836_11685, partial [Candidatus Binataceae bacterium]